MVPERAAALGHVAFALLGFWVGLGFAIVHQLALLRLLALRDSSLLLGCAIVRVAVASLLSKTMLTEFKED